MEEFVGTFTDYVEAEHAIKSEINFKAIEKECARRGITVDEYMDEYAQHLRETYARWKQTN